MAEAQWLLKEDGYINIDSDCSNIIYHPNLNIILVFSKHGYVDVLDVNSGVVLTRTSQLSEETEAIRGRYLPEQDRVLFWDGKNIGLRGDYNNVLLLDTILQTPIHQIYATVKVELLLSEAILIQQSLDNLEKHGLENTAEVMNELTLKINEAQQNAKKKGIKAQKWETICLELPHGNLKVAASGVVMHLKRLDCHIPALAIASAVNERLTDLFYGARLTDKQNPNTQRFHMFSEAARQQTFEQWPHMDYKWALPDQMAQAGFYYHPSKRGDDRAMCFTCNVCLVCWEKTDEPWSEHERHSADCPFVKGEYTQNVPLAITYATSPATATNGFTLVSNGDRGIIICTGTTSGEMIIWNVEKQLQNFHKFDVSNDKNAFLTKMSLASEDENSYDIRLSALCTFKTKNSHSLNNNNQSSNNYKKTLTMTLKSKIIGSKIFCGINMKNNVDDNVHGDGDNNNDALLLVVYGVEDNNTAQSTNDNSICSSNASNAKNNSLSTKESLTSLQTNKKSSLCTIEEKSEDDFQYLSIYHLFSDNLSTPSIMNKNPKWNEEKPFKKSSSGNMLTPTECVVSSLLHQGGPIISQDSNPYILGNSSSSMSDMSGTLSSASSLSTPNNEIQCNPIQMVTLNISKAHKNMEITEIIPSNDYKHILVIVKNQGITQMFVYNLDENGVIDEIPLCDKTYDDVNDSCPKEIIMLPKCDNNGRPFGGLDSEHGIFAMICNNGSLNIVSLTTLRTISEVAVDKHKFVSLTYCKNLERLCACTGNGSLHFYSFYDLDAESSDGREDENQYINMSDEVRERDSLNKIISEGNVETDSAGRNKQTYDDSKPSTSTSSSSAMPNLPAGSEIPTASGNSDIIAYKKSLSINDLKILYSLTLFDEMLTPYSAEVPVCWSKLVQAQKQRRQQHLQFSDDTHLTRTWRLHNDATTWDEHLIELSLPKMASLGHIDFKFNLYKPCNNPPAIQVTLLKQKSIGLCFRRKTQTTSSCVDDNIDFNISSNDTKDSVENPVLNDEYLQARNAEVIAGPIELSSCMDLSDQGGVVTLTGPKLLKTKGRNYLLHIKTMADLSKEGQGKTRVTVRKKGITSILLSSFSNTASQNSCSDRITFFQDSKDKSRKNDYYIGCDWLHEISITARSTRHVHKISNERLQRISILESNLLLENLLKILANNESYLHQNLSLDILIWIVTIRMSRYRSPSNKYRITTDRKTSISEIASSDVSVQQSECIEIIQKYLVDIIKNCILLNNRTIAHKCVKLLILSLDGAENMLYKKQYLDYEEAFMYAILINLPEVLNAEYSGSLRWFTILISGTSTIESQGPISEKCVQLLIDITSELAKRTNINNSLLSTRFGLYGLPFESEIFDTELPILVKNNPTFAYASILKSSYSNNSQGQQSSQLHSNKGFSTGSDQSEPKKLPFQLNIGNHFKGLLEVEPLHFICCEATEATRLENVESGNLQTTNMIDDILLDTPSQNNIETVHVSQNFGKKEPEKDGGSQEDMMNNVKNILVDKIFYSAIKKHKLQEKIKKLSIEDLDAAPSEMTTAIDTTTTPSDDGWATYEEPRVVYLTPNNFNDQNIDSILDGINTTSTTLTNKIHEFLDDTPEDMSTSFPWHKLLNTQPKQMIIVDRMHSGARRHITLDFGTPTLLTDIVFPACVDVACISIDVWCFTEEADSVRLVVSNDIGIKTLVLSDLQPPPICRFMKITFTGRYGMSATRCRIPIGLFYGHVIVLEKEGYADHVMKYIKNKKSNVAAQLKALNSLFEDVHCRYCLASSKLSDLLKPLLNGETSNIAHIQAYLNKSKDSNENSPENSKIVSVYEECISFQNQLNIIQRVIKRLEQSNVTKTVKNDKITNLADIYTDKLRFLSDCMIEMLLHFIITYGSANINEINSLFDLKTCNQLFDTLVIAGDTQIQLATCSLLVKMCCFQPWWGDFFADIFTKLYSSQNSRIFPQDRVFFFLTYLGRKSISMGTCRSIVIDAILKSIAGLLVPLSQTYNQGLSLWSTTDLNLLGWLLLFLSVCLDGIDKKDQSQSKWDFMSGEADMVKSRLSLGNNSLRTLTRSLKKRFSQKQHFNSNVAEKFFMMSSDQMSQNAQLEIAIKQHENQLKKIHNTKLFGDYLNDMVKTKMIIIKPNENAVNTNVLNSPGCPNYLLIKKKNNANYNNSNNINSSDTSNMNGIGNNINTSSSNIGNNMNSSNSSNNSSSQSSSQQTIKVPPYTRKTEDSGSNDTAFDKGLKSLNSDNILVVVRGLIGLILNMDFTCNMDLFLLTCKIIARLVLASHPSNSLSKLMTTTQLLQLVRIAVWENQQQPWAVHAITCLLQDILAADKRVNNSGSNNNINNIVEIDADGEIIETDDMGSDLSNFKLIISPQVTKDMSYAEAVKFQLPSLLECEDAEMEDLLDDFLERDKKGLKKDNVSMRNGITTILYRTISSAMDARLEYGLDTNIEITLRRLTMKSSLNLCATLPQIAMSETIHASFDLEPWPENIVQPWSGAEYDQDIRTNVMLTEIFDNIFTDLHMESSWLSLEKILELWLTLNVEAGDQVTRRSKIPFGEKAVCGLMKALATHPSINLRAWCLGFQCLIFACKPFIDHSDYDMPNENSSRNMDAYIVQNPFFPRMLNRFFSGADKANSTLDGNRYAGPSICKLIMELFVCLELKPHVKEKLKEILLQVVLHLIQYDGAISIQQGPIDAQSRLIKELLILQYEKTDLGVAMSIIESVSNLVYNNIANVEKVYCQKSSETNNSSNVFGSLFATVLGPESSRKCKTVTDSTLLVDLLKLSSILILTKIPRNDAENPNPSDSFNEHNLSNESQTDEIKAAEQHSNEPREKPLCFADTVLQHSPTMTRFFGSLSQCSNSLFAMLVATSMYTVAPSNETKNALGEPRNVSDALFQLLIYLSKTSTQPILVIKPLFEFISFATSMRHAMPKLQLSEPFSWFILEVLETPTSVKLFTEMGGIKVLCESLVRSNRCLINTQPSLVSMIMQRFISRSSTLQSSLPGTSSNKKTSTNPVKNDEGLINFAPYCTITSETGTAQPVDVLIQAPIASHRRARNPAWSYLFYPKEAHVDLKITLPTAVLLKEIQLQPHLSTLASCPSAIAIEITRDNNLGPIPITQPVSTVGMTCIRLRLSQPEIATSVIIRLYRPKDSSSIGLTQVLLLGTTTFNDSSNISSASSTNLVNRSILNSNIATQNNNSNNDNMANEDDTITKTSFGWLRILAQCFNVASYNNPNNTSNASSSNVQNIDNSQLLSEMIESAASVNGFLEACCALLNIGSARTNMALQNLETVLLKIGLHSVHLGLKLIDNLLKESIPQTFKMCNDSVSDLLYHLCTAQDSFTKTRIEEMLIWLRDLRNQFHSDDNLVQATNPYSGFVKCLSSILWQSYATNLILDLPNLITKQLFESLYNWLTILNADEPLKVAIDAMMCSICCIRPELFTVLLKKMEIFIPNLSTDLSACISDDRKDSDSNNSRMTDDIKQEESDLGEWYSHLVIQDLSKLSLTKSQLDTIALACQSPLAIQLLIDSGLPNLLTSAILEFCHRTNNNKIKSSNIDSPSSSSSCLTDSDKAENNNKLNSYPMVTIEKIKEILGFFTDICAEGHMRDWLGSYEGSIFWQPLLVLLCNNKFYNDDSHNSMITPQPYMELEESVIKFLSAVTSCHPKNQNNLSICLIAVIRKSDENLAGKMKAHPYSKASISSFTRRLVLQILLESEKIVVSVRSDLPLQKKESLNQQTYYVSNHPSKRPNSHYLLFYLSANSKCQEILENYVSVYSNIMPSITTENRNSAESSKTQSQSSILRETRKELLEMGMGIGMEFLSVAAGVTAKDKRLKEVKNQAATMKAKDLFTAFKLSMDDSKGLSSDSAQLTHSSCPDVVITSDTTIAQILAMLKYVGFPLSTPCINLNIVQGVKQQPGSMSAAAQLHNQSDHIDMDSSIKAADFLPLPSPLQIFSARGGLSLLAHYLPTVYPEASKSQQQNGDKDKTQPVSEWVKVEQNEEIYEDLDDMLVDSTPRVSTITSVPQHSLSACGLFLKLPAYSEVLIRDKVRAQCLLRLILGVTGDGEGNEIYSLALSSSLPTLPFEVFRQLLDSSPLTTDDGVLLRRKVIEIGAIHLILNCLGIFTHHSSYISSPQDQVSTSGAAAAPKASGSTAEDQPSDDKSHVYWAKGTGFGTGSTQQSWNVEQALLRQKSEEEHVTILLQVLSSYINPGDKVPVPIETGDDEEEELNYHETNETLPELPPIFLDFLQQSCLIPALCSYLSNDSVLDITRHIPLYRAILQLLRAISLSSQLITLLIATQNRDGKTSIASLLLSMKACVDTYASRLKINKKSNGKNNVPKMSAALDDSDDEGLALLIPDIQETAILVQNATTFLDASDKEDDDKISMDYPIKKSLEEKYLEVIKKLQFDSYDMIKETDSESGFRFTISHHFETNVRMAGERGHPQRVKRLAQEAVTLSTSLPLSYSSSVFVRYDTDRLDIMKVLITGPADTPYANGCFEFDIYFPTDYPNSPMMINLETTGKHSVRFNPNLYNDGKVCLSVLNTWHGRPEEKWNAQTSSFLQVLVSIQSLILVPEPYFNEPGFERSRGTPSGSHSSREYNSNIYQACVRWAMLEQLKNPCPCFKDVIHTHFWLKRNEICTQIEGWIAELSKPQQNERSGRTLSYNANVLRRQYRQLREELAKLPIPEGLEDFDNPFSANITTNAPSNSSTSTSAMPPSDSIPATVTAPPPPVSPQSPASPVLPATVEEQAVGDQPVNMEEGDKELADIKQAYSMQKNAENTCDLFHMAMMANGSIDLENDFEIYSTLFDTATHIASTTNTNNPSNEDEDIAMGDNSFATLTNSQLINMLENEDVGVEEEDNNDNYLPM